MGLEPVSPAGTIRLTTSAPAAIRNTLVVERLQDGTWRAVHTFLPITTRRPTSPPPDCLTLPAGSSLLLMPWSGESCSTTCNRCSVRVSYGAGPFRVAALSCTGDRITESAPFTMPAGDPNAARN